MFKKLSKGILGSKATASKSKPYSDIPIFDDVGSIGMPGLSGVESTSNRNMREESKDEGESKYGESKSSFSPARPVLGVKSQGDRSTGKRSRCEETVENVNDILQDKENVPRIPKAANIMADLHSHDMGMKKQKKSVTIQEEPQVASATLSSGGADSRFDTHRLAADRANSKQDFEDADWLGDDDDDNGESEEEGGGMENDEKISMREYLFSKVRHNHFSTVESAIQGGQHDFQGRYAKDENGNTLMHVAVQNNLKKMCSLLITRAGCSINAENKKHMTPLDYAELYRFTPLADWLLSKGAVNGATSQQQHRK